MDSLIKHLEIKRGLSGSHIFLQVVPILNSGSLIAFLDNTNVHHFHTLSSKVLVMILKEQIRIVCFLYKETVTMGKIWLRRAALHFLFGNLLAQT